MARVTVEDCLDNVDNRFELVLVAAKRARQLANGKQSYLADRTDEKPTVLALREISKGHVTRDILKQEDAPPAAPAPVEERVDDSSQLDD